MENENVRDLQKYLALIGRTYTSLKTVPITGYYGEVTEAAVRDFQKAFGLPQTGVVDYQTWYKIQEIFVGITRIAELS